MRFERDVVVVGGCGHVGLPLALTLADAALRVGIYDVNGATVDSINQCRMPFNEPGAPEILSRVAGTSLVASCDPTIVSTAEHVIVVVGTPVDEHLNPDAQAVPAAVVELEQHFRDGQIIVLRSTIYPGVTALVERVVYDLGRQVDVVFCPERIAEGKAITELFELPQLIGSRSPAAADRAEKLFRVLTDKIVHLRPEEAELAKLFTNTWRYIKFATANQLYMIANDFGLDYERIRSAVAFEYSRAADLPSAGFAAGPCLLKDTMQLAAFNNNNFVLGHASMMVNEGLPLYLVSRIETQYDLSKLTVGILGMAFKGDSDDIRSSLSYKLKRILRFKAHRVLCTDPYVREDPDLLPLDDVLDGSDLLVIGAPHGRYADMECRQQVVDIWGIRGMGVRV
jgi:UDP-N-acetyl-D-mannosaminuronic acid dehydrogenase